MGVSVASRLPTAICLRRTRRPRPSRQSQPPRTSMVMATLQTIDAGLCKRKDTARDINRFPDHRLPTSDLFPPPLPVVSQESGLVGFRGAFCGPPAAMNRERFSGTAAWTLSGCWPRCAKPPKVGNAMWSRSATPAAYTRSVRSISRAGPKAVTTTTRSLATSACGSQDGNSNDRWAGGSS